MRVQKKSHLRNQEVLVVGEKGVRSVVLLCVLLECDGVRQGECPVAVDRNLAGPVQ